MERKKRGKEGRDIERKTNGLRRRRRKKRGKETERQRGRKG